MEYVALNDSFDGSRKPRYCHRGGVYSFDTDPGAAFRPLYPAREEERSDKDILIEQAEKIGVKIDKRWSVEKLTEAIESHGDE